MTRRCLSCECDAGVTGRSDNRPSRTEYFIIISLLQHEDLAHNRHGDNTQSSGGSGAPCEHYSGDGGTTTGAVQAVELNLLPTTRRVIVLVRSCLMQWS